LIGSGNETDITSKLSLCHGAKRGIVSLLVVKPTLHQVQGGGLSTAPRSTAMDTVIDALSGVVAVAGIFIK